MVLQYFNKLYQLNRNTNKQTRKKIDYYPGQNLPVPLCMEDVYMQAGKSLIPENGAYAGKCMLSGHKGACTENLT